MVAGIDDRVKLLAIAHPSHTEHAGLHYDKASGFPFYVHKSRGEHGTAAHELATVAATRYYDVINFAKRYDGPVLNHISYEDDISLAAGIFAAHNEFSGEKVLMHWLDMAIIHRLLNTGMADSIFLEDTFQRCKHHLGLGQERH